MVPLIFEPYAEHLAARLAAMAPKRVLETAAGTGVVTRRMAARLPDSTTIVATDLNQAMLDEAASVGTARPVQWRQADAMQLPFADASFDAVVCQFGAMFFPDKAKGYAEARRVLVPGGVFLFDVWDRIEENEIADTVTAALRRHLSRRPAALHGAHPARLSPSSRPSLATSGTAASTSRPRWRPSPRAAAPRRRANRRWPIAWARRCAARSRRATGRSWKRRPTRPSGRSRARFGSGAVDARIQAHIVSVVR